MKKYGERAVSACILLVGTVLFVAAQYIDIGAAMAKDGDFMPKIAATLLLILGAVQFFSSWRDLKTTPACTDAPAGGEKPKGNYQALFLNIFLLITYVLFLYPAGFLVATAAYVGLQTYLYAPKEPRYRSISAVIGVLSSVIIYYTFVYGFELLLPAGILG